MHAAKSSLVLRLSPYSVFCLLSSVFCLLLATGCEPEQVTGPIQDVIGQAHYQATDPCSPVQVTAEQLKQMTDSATILVTAAEVATGFPYAKTILGALAVMQAVLALILSWRKKKTQTALEEVIAGNEALKKQLPADQATVFKQTQNAAQSIGTIKQIAEIRREITA